ncbi:uncharacterized protein LOC111880052 isoform X1 [Lactuca sativa]|uniref:Transmembrane protein n=1 Tax=Lactuca sativa TaxID=4236 RepID=A0A9R1WD24_LACSA|nr:uncharacterized protein LOC111880052 isoform X1 [Lactuca sativa]KAJ0221638.1 hypothetical protein LSAT_V11C200064780 [Lactuca sativa]
MVFLIFYTHIHPTPPPLRNQQLWPAPAISQPFFPLNPTPTFPRRIHTKARRWDSNAETFRTQSFDFNSGDDDDDDDFEDDDANQWLDILEDFIDGVWIFKVFRSFGWFLPAIISSLLLTSGPKAFLMAMAIPLGQSALSMLFQTVWGRPKNKTRRRGKSKSEGKRKPPPPPRRGGASYVDMDEEEYPRGERKRAPGYQTWVAGDGGASDNKSGGSSASFGGWEELDRKSGSFTDGKRKPLKSKLSRRERRSTTPLFFRLLIAVFPFLGSWTRML